MGKLYVGAAGFFYHLVIVSAIALVMVTVGGFVFDGIGAAFLPRGHASLEDRVYLLEYQQGLSHNPSDLQMKKVKHCETVMATAVTGAMDSLQAKLACDLYP